jgi:methyl-accepting chemotaxis protein
MKRYKEAGFKDDPTIASEYVKFLAANSGTDAVEKVSNRMTSVETELKEAAKLARNAGTSASTASNKVDEVKKTLAELLRRVTKVEGKA